MDNSVENWTSNPKHLHNVENTPSSTTVPSLPSFPPLCYPPQPSPVDGANSYLVPPSMASPSNCLAVPSQQSYPYSSHTHPYYSGMLASQQSYFPPPPPFYSSYYPTNPQIPTSSALTYNHQNSLSNLASSCPASSPIIPPLHSPLHLPPVPLAFPVQLPKSDSLGKSSLPEDNYLPTTANSYAYPTWNCAVEHESLRLAQQYSSCQVEDAYRNRETNTWNPVLPPEKVIDEPPKILPLPEVEELSSSTQDRYKSTGDAESVKHVQDPPPEEPPPSQNVTEPTSNTNAEGEYDDSVSTSSSSSSSKGSSHNLLSPGAESFLSSENESIDLGFEHLSETEGVDLLQDSPCFNDLQSGNVSSLSNLPNFDLMPSSRNEALPMDNRANENDDTAVPSGRQASPTKEVSEMYYENHENTVINKENFVSGDIEEAPLLICYFCQVQIQAFQDINEIHRSVPAGTVTSATKTPVLGKLSTILDYAFQHEEQGWVLCRRCFVLIDRVDLLEIELMSVKQEIFRTYELIYKRNEPSPPAIVPQPTPEPVQDQTEVNKPVNSCNMVNILQDDKSESESELSPRPGILTEVENVISESNEEKKIVKTSHSCSVCEKSFSTRISLKRHIQLHNGQYSFNCDQCSRGFTSKHSLKNHLMKHTGDRKYVCPVCAKGFIQKVHFKAHMSTHDGNYRLKCELCNKGFPAKTALQVHMRSHTKEKPYECVSCHRGFTVKSNLTAHMAACSGKHPWVCEQCGKGFSLRSVYEKHLKAHEGKFDHCCDMCDAGFQKLSQLKAHMRTHTKEKPFLCHVCGRGFASQSNCRAHEKTHTDERRFSCEVCGKGFGRKYALNLHLSRHERTDAEEAT